MAVPGGFNVSFSVKAMGWTVETAVGEPFTFGRNADAPMGEVIGVVENFHIESLRSELSAVVLQMEADRFSSSSGVLAAQLDPNGIRDGAEHIEQVMARLAPETRFEYTLLHCTYTQTPVHMPLLPLFTRRFIIMRFLPALLVLALCMLGSLTSERAVAQTLTPEREATCDAATASAIPLNAGEGGACARRTYELAPASTLMLRQENYDTVEIDAWDGSTIQIETTVVARQATQDAAQADLQRITLNRQEMNEGEAEASRVLLSASGPDGDAPGWWSVRYRLRVPAQTTLDISSKNSSITVRDVVGAHRLQSKNGSLTYRVPVDAGVRLQTETENGIIETTFPVTTEGTVSTRHLQIVVGESGPEVFLATKNGDVTIQRAQ